MKDLQTILSKFLSKIIVQTQNEHYFFQVLSEPRFRSIEKIKTIKSTYMAAAGLKPEYEVKQTKTSLQNRRNFLRISGEHGGESEASASCVRGEDRLELHPSHATRASRSPRFRPCSPEIRKNTPVLQANKNKRLRSALRTWKS